MREEEGGGAPQTKERVNTEEGSKEKINETKIPLISNGKGQVTIGDHGQVVHCIW